MMVWRLEVEDVGCPVDDMGKVDVFTFLCSELERMVVGGRTRAQEVTTRVQEGLRHRWVPTRRLSQTQITGV